MLPAPVDKDEQGGWKGKPVVTRVHPTRPKSSVLGGPQGKQGFLPLPVCNHYRRQPHPNMGVSGWWQEGGIDEVSQHSPKPAFLCSMEGTQGSSHVPIRFSAQPRVEV